MKIFWLIWGCICAAMGAGLIKISIMLARWDLLIFNIVMLGFGLYGCYFMMTQLEDNNDKNGP